MIPNTAWCSLCLERWQENDIIVRGHRGTCHESYYQAVQTAESELGMWVSWFEKYPHVNVSMEGRD